jgi:hypothetical protein
MAGRIKTVGETYTQYPGEKSPAELFGGQWTKLYANESVFFRTEGPNAKPFNGGKQGDAIRNLTGDLGINAWYSADHANTGVFRTRKYGGHSRAQYKSGTMVSFDASRQVPTANENRPTNYTYRIWKCVGY